MGRRRRADGRGSALFDKTHAGLLAAEAELLEGLSCDTLPMPLPPPHGKQRAAALGCRAHTGWAALVVVAGGIAQPEVLLRGRAELGDRAEQVRRNVYQSSRGLKLAEAAALVEAAERIADE